MRCNGGYVLVLVLGACRCSASNTDGVPSDGGASSDVAAEADTGSRKVASRTADSGVKTTQQYDGASATDASQDLLSPDAGENSLTRWFGGTWSALPGMPDECGLRQADKPAESIQAFPWQACPSGRSGCQIFHTTWGGEGGHRSLDLFQREPAFIRGKPYFGFVRIVPTNKLLAGSYAYSAVVAPLTGSGIWGIGNLKPVIRECSFLGGIGAEGPFLGISFAHEPHQYDGWKAQSWVGWSQWTDPNNLQLFSISNTELGGEVLGPRPYGNRVYMKIGGIAAGDGSLIPPDKTAIFDTVSKTFRFPTPDGSKVLELPIPVEGGAYVYGMGRAISTFFLGTDGVTTKVLDPGPLRDVAHFGIDKSNRNAMVWFESDASQIDNKNIELWTSPAATSEVQVKRRKAAILPDDVGRDMQRGAPPVINAGVVLLARNKREGLLIRLSDGKGWRVPWEPGRPLVAPVWVDEEAAWFLTTAVDDDDYFYRSDGMIRIERTTLGEPTIPSGL